MLEFDKNDSVFRISGYTLKIYLKEAYTAGAAEKNFSTSDASNYSYKALDRIIKVALENE